MPDRHQGNRDLNEMTLVSAVLAAAPPPGPEVTAQARQRLAERMAASGRPAAPVPGGPAAAGRLPEPVPGGPAAAGRLPEPVAGERAAADGAGRPRRGRFRWPAALAGVAAAGLAGALAVTALQPANPGRGERGHAAGGGTNGLITSEVLPGGVLTSDPAGPVLTALANRVARTSAATGKYWCQATVAGQLDPIGPGGQELTPAGEGATPSPVSDYRYSIFARQRTEDCFEYTAAAGRNVGGWYQDLGAQPATAKDAAAWRRAGSPAWHAWYGNGQLIPSRPGPRRALGGKPGLGPPVASLPASAAVLRKVLLAELKHDPNLVIPESQPGANDARIVNENLFEQARILLMDPLRPAVRAAAYRVLASVPGVHARPGVADASGRTGTALWFGARSRPDWIVIVDPATGMLLADEWLATAPHGVYAPGTLLQYDLWQTLGWTSRVPHS